MAKKKIETAQSKEKTSNKATVTKEPGDQNSKFILKLSILLALAFVIYVIFLLGYNDKNETPITLTLPKLKQDATISSSEVSNIVTEFITPKLENDSFLKQETKQQPNNSTKSEDLSQVLNHLKYLEQKIEKIEKQLYSNQAVIQKEYRAILSLALRLNKKIQTGSPFNREIILLQLETEDVFINGKITDMSEYAVDGIATIAELSLEFADLRDDIAINLHAPLNSENVVAKAFDGFITVKRKHKIPSHIADNLNLIQQSINDDDLKKAVEYFSALPAEYKKPAVKFSQRLQAAFVVRKAVDGILRYLDV